MGLRNTMSCLVKRSDKGQTLMSFVMVIFLLGLISDGCSH